MATIDEDGGGRFDVSGKVVLVTGGTRGLGRAMAEGLARGGAQVVVTGRKTPSAEAAAAEIAVATGARTLGVGCHMGDWAQIDQLVDRVVGDFGRIDVLVNNAGINPAFAPVTEVTSEFFDKLYAVNVKGPMRLAGRVAPVMAETGGGSVVNIVTVGAYEGGPGVGIYTSAKAALLNLTRVMAMEWADRNIRVNAIAPGPFLTDMMKGAGGNQRGFIEGAASATMQKRVADPEELVGAILFLASDASTFVTGEDLRVAGGMR